jgi:hypothetical protein
LDRDVESGEIMKPIRVVSEKHLKLVFLLQENQLGDVIKIMIVENDNIKKLSDLLNAALAEINNAAN